MADHLWLLAVSVCLFYLHSSICLVNADYKAQFDDIYDLWDAVSRSMAVVFQHHMVTIIGG